MERNKVLELSSHGFTQSDIATVLHVTQPTVNKDLAHIRREAQENLQNHIHETIPQEYQKAMTGINQVLRMCWGIVSKTEDEKTKLQALSLINDCNKYKIDLSTNGVVITDAIKYVNGKMDHLNNQEKKLLQDIKKVEDIEGKLEPESGIEKQAEQLQTVSSK